MNILQAIADPKVFGKHFTTDTWGAWLAFLCALFALPMTAEQLELYRKHTGRTSPPSAPFQEAWLCIGRRGGKSFMLALIAVFLACFRDWRPFLAAGEVGTVMIIAADRRQARVCLRFVLGLPKSVPMLKQLIVGETTESISLRNRIVIEVHTASYRTTRGYTAVAVLCDEVAFWPSDELAARADIEIVNALRPSLATVPGSVLLGASSPHARRGVLWNAYRKHYGQDSAVLVWHAPTRSMNATVRQSIIDDAMADDRPRALAEYYAQFRVDVETFISREVVEANVEVGCIERPPIAGQRYHAFVDPSGGSSDSMTLCVGHKDEDAVIIDCLREVKPPFSPEYVVHDFAAVLRSYNISKIVGDKYAGEWPREQFRKLGIDYEPSAQPKGNLYLDLLPKLNSRRIELLDHTKCINQLCGLERRTARGGRDSVDHAPNAHDDLINAVAGLASIVGAGGFDATLNWVNGEDATREPLYTSSSTNWNAVRRSRYQELAWNYYGTMAGLWKH
jgi:hypothetical protein